jgi:hypothetical protein
LASTKCWEVLEWLHSRRLLKKDSAPWVSEYGSIVSDCYLGCFLKGCTDKNVKMVIHLLLVLCLTIPEA